MLVFAAMDRILAGKVIDGNGRSHTMRAYIHARGLQDMSIHAAICEAIESSGQTLYRVAKDSGVDYATVYRFVNDQADVLSVTADKLLEYFEIELKRKRRK
jgi:hypothetical protein